MSIKLLRFFVVEMKNKVKMFDASNWWQNILFQNFQNITDFGFQIPFNFHST